MLYVILFNKLYVILFNKFYLINDM